MDYAPILWMFCSKTYLKREKSRGIRFWDTFKAWVTDNYKPVTVISSEYMKGYFEFENILFSLRNDTDLIIPATKTVKKTLWLLFMDGFRLFQGYRATTRRQFNFYHSFLRSFWYSIDGPRKDERLSWLWNYLVVLNAWDPWIGNPAP